MIFFVSQSSPNLLHRKIAPRLILVGIPSLHDAGLFEDIADTMDSIFHPDTPYRTVDLIIPRLDEQQCRIPDTTTVADPPPPITLFEDLFIRQRLPTVYPLRDYQLWKQCILGRIRIVVSQSSEKGNCILLLPYWTLYPDWLPATMTSHDRDTTVSIAPLAIDPSPPAGMYYTESREWEEHIRPL